MLITCTNCGNGQYSSKIEDVLPGLMCSGCRRNDQRVPA